MRPSFDRYRFSLGLVVVSSCMISTQSLTVPERRLPALRYWSKFINPPFLWTTLLLVIIRLWLFKWLELLRLRHDMTCDWLLSPALPALSAISIALERHADVITFGCKCKIIRLIVHPRGTINSIVDVASSIRPRTGGNKQGHTSSHPLTSSTRSSGFQSRPATNILFCGA